MTVYTWSCLSGPCGVVRRVETVQEERAGWKSGLVHGLCGRWVALSSFLPKTVGLVPPHRAEMIQKWPGSGCLGSVPQFPSLQNRILFSQCSKAGTQLKCAFFFSLSPNCRVNLGSNVSLSLNFFVCVCNKGWWESWRFLSATEWITCGQTLQRF